MPETLLETKFVLLALECLYGEIAEWAMAATCAAHRRQNSATEMS